MEQRERASTLNSLGRHGSQSSSWMPFSSNHTMSNSPPSSASSIRSLRKRHSFFGRSSSDASRSRKLSTPQSSISEDQEVQDIPSRPNTALSTEQPRRRLTEPLESLRNSIFGGRKNEAVPASKEQHNSTTSGEPTTDAQFSSGVPSWSREHFRTKEDFDRYLTKQTISPPFNFQHITHTAKTQLPALETVDEKDLPGEFWSVSAYQRPRRHLNGIRADDLGKKHRQLGIKRGSPSSRPTSPIYTDHNNDRPFIPETIESVVGLSETTFDEARETRFHPDDGIKALQPAKQVLKYPKRFSSLNALNDLQQSDETKREPLGTFYESNSSNSSGEAEIRSVSPVSAVDSTENILDFPVPPKGSPELRKEDIAYRAKQPLPPLPRQKAASKPSQSCLISRSKTSTSNVSLIIPVQQPLSPRSKRSSRSSLSVRKSLTFSSSTALTDATWEDDVDFCYEQAAESTCDFNWDGSSHPKEDLAQKSQDDRSISPYHAYSPTTSNGSGTSLPFSGSSETIAERRRSRAAAAGQGHHKRGSSSVGHRGFLAARKSTTDLNARSTPSPAPLQLLPGSSQTSVLSPVFSVTSPDDEPRQASLTPAKMQFSGLEGTNTFYLSDPESCRNSGSSKHRKSSSYGSHESAARPATVPARETNRWSVASANSLPELMHSRPKSKLIFSKTIISAPLETLPQSPQSDATTIEESTIVPRELQTQPSRSSFVMRRPQTPSDRAVLQAAGKSVQQRGSRPPTPKRLSRFDMTPSGVGVPDAPAAGPEWI